MPRIRYVCMSDLHLGADSSLLTELRPGRPANASDVMRSLCACLEPLLADGGEPKPTLILLGDVLELALAKDEDAATVFQRFAELATPAGGELFSEIWFVPGNHDHHLWEGARETQYATYVGRRHIADPLAAPWHSTRMMAESDPDPVSSSLLTALLRRARPSAEQEKQLTVTTVYPNLGIRRGDRCIAFHHGHFTESVYSLISTLDTCAFKAKEPANVWDLEADNFAWIDFLWSGLGRSGAAGERVNYIFSRLQDSESRSQLIDEVSTGLAGALRLTSWEWLERLADPGERLLIRIALGRLAALGDPLGRRAYYGGASPERALNDDLRHYIGKYVSGQIEGECGGELPPELTFVFGHTHSPFQSADVAIGESEPHWQVFNTGGWVHESAERQPGIGASLVLIDEDLTPVAVRLYDEGSDLSSWRVHAEEPREPHSAFFAEVEALLARDANRWREFVRTVEDALCAHCERFGGATAGQSQTRSGELSQGEAHR